MEASAATTENGLPVPRSADGRARGQVRPAGAAGARGGRPRSPDRLTVMLFSTAAFLVTLALLAGQMRSVAVTHGPRTVVVRRVYSTRIIETLIGSSSARAGSVTQSVSSSGSGSGATPAPAVATRTS